MRRSVLCGGQLGVPGSADERCGRRGRQPRQPGGEVAWQRLGQTRERQGKSKWSREPGRWALAKSLCVRCKQHSHTAHGPRPGGCRRRAEERQGAAAAAACARGPPEDDRCKIAGRALASRHLLPLDPAGKLGSGALCASKRLSATARGDRVPQPRQCTPQRK